MRNRLAKACFGLVTLSFLAGSIGCYESLFRLAPIADAKVDRALCGDWKLRSTHDSEIRLAVRNLDDHLYSVDWKNVDDSKSIYMVADSTEIQGVRFIHARALPDDGTLADTHLLVRVDLDGNHIAVRNLNEEFIKQKGVDSDESLRQLIETSLENNDLYDDVIFTGERVTE